jgi:cold shock protein
VLVATGKLCVFDPVKGFGFIQPDDGSSQVFIHADDLGGRLDLNAGTPVKFSSIQGFRWPKAYNVRVLTPTVGRDDVEPRDDAFRTARNRSRSVTSRAISGPVYAQEITNVLVSALPDITATQIVQVRAELMKHAARRGWLRRGR